MSSAAIALPRVRLRFKPPTGRQVYWALLSATILGFIAKAVVGFVAGEGLWNALLGVGWSINYVLHRANERRDRLEEERRGAALPVTRREWTWLRIMILFQVWMWVELALGN